MNAALTHAKFARLAQNVSAAFEEHDMKPKMMAQPKNSIYTNVTKYPRDNLEQSHALQHTDHKRRQQPGACHRRAPLRSKCPCPVWVRVVYAEGLKSILGKTMPSSCTRRPGL